MRTLLALCLCLIPFGALDAQDKVELTKVDLFGLGSLPMASQISVMGVSIGDPFEESIKKIGRSRGSVKSTKKNFTVDLGKDDLRLISRDNRTVTSIAIFPNFRDKTIGKTAEYFSQPSVARAKEFLIQNIGKPGYIYELGSMGWCWLIYSNGLVFRLFGNENSISIEDPKGIEEEINNSNTKKFDDFEKPVARPGTSTSAGFRNALWGMTKEQVKASESSEFVKEGRLDGDMAGLELLTYKTGELGASAFIAYYFAGDALTRARYIIAETHSDTNAYIQDFKKFKDQITDKYGAPARDQKIWSNELFKDDPSRYGTALASGHVTYVAEWYPKETVIQLLMRGDNFKVTLWVEYTGEMFADYEKDVIKRSRKSIW